MQETQQKAYLLILGKGEIARYLAELADNLDYQVEVMESDITSVTWPSACKLREGIFSHTPFTLPAESHAIIARGHDGDAESLATLLNNGASHVYLIASARRAEAVINAAAPLIEDPSRLSHLSAPAGLELGGRSSAEIALSIIAEIQMHRYATSAKPLTDSRKQRIKEKNHSTSDESCPGKRL